MSHSSKTSRRWWEVAFTSADGSSDYPFLNDHLDRTFDASDHARDHNHQQCCHEIGPIHHHHTTQPGDQGDLRCSLPPHVGDSHLSPSLPREGGQEFPAVAVVADQLTREFHRLLEPFMALPEVAPALQHFHTTFATWCAHHPDLLGKLIALANDWRHLIQRSPRFERLVWWWKSFVPVVVTHPQLAQEIVALSVIILRWYMHYPHHFGRALRTVTHLLRWFQHHSRFLVREAHLLERMGEALTQNPEIFLHLLSAHLTALNWIHEHHADAIQLRAGVDRILERAHQHPALTESFVNLGHFLEEVVDHVPAYGERVGQLRWQFLMALLPEITPPTWTRFEDLRTQLHHILDGYPLFRAHWEHFLGRMIATILTEKPDFLNKRG